MALLIDTMCRLNFGVTFSVEEEENITEEFSAAASENGLVPWKFTFHQDVFDGNLVSKNTA